MTRYVGTGAGSWHGDWYVYVPSAGDRAEARAFADYVAADILRRRGRRTGYGATVEARTSWLVTGFLGECAALLPFGSGPSRAERDIRTWRGRADLGDLEVRTTSTRQLYGFARHPDRWEPGLGGWRVVAKDAGRIVVCVHDRTRAGDLAVMGYVRADDVPRLYPAALGAILAVIEPGDLLPFAELVPEAVP